MKIKNFFLVTLLSLLLFFIVAPLRGFGGGFPTSSLIGYIVYFILTIWCLNKFKDSLKISHILLALFIGHWLIELPLRILHFNSTLISLPDSVIHTLGIVCGFLYWYLKNPLKVITALFGISIAVFMYFQGWNNWLHLLNHGTFTGKVNTYNLPTKFESFNESKESITENNFNNKIVLLDFWTTTCGICFQKFPQLQAVYEKYKQDSSVLILAVDTPLEEDKPNQAFEMIKARNYTFPVVITKDADLAEKWGVIGYPTTFVINPNGQIVYRGDIEGAVRMVDELKSAK